MRSTAARAAQVDWARRSTAERARLIGGFVRCSRRKRRRIAEITAAVGERPVAEKLVSEVLPLLDACRFLQKNAARILRTTALRPPRSPRLAAWQLVRSASEAVRRRS